MITLDDDIAESLREQASLRGVPLEQVVNETLRRAMPPAAHEGPHRTFRIRTFSSEYGPDIDPNDPKAFKNFLNQLDDEHFLNVQRYGAGNP